MTSYRREQQLQAFVPYLFHIALRRSHGWGPAVWVLCRWRDGLWCRTVCAAIFWFDLTYSWLAGSTTAPLPWWMLVVFG